jgi:hypothetical protein
MGDYWGARAYPAHGGPNGEGQHYVMPPAFTENFTSPPSEGNPMTIDEIKQRINNMHPEDIAVLADQWQNAYTLMSQVKAYVFEQSTVLHDEHWRDAQAREYFMKSGPGETLAYLDMWMDAAQENVTALRGLVTVVQQARTDMARLWQRYEQALKDAQNLDGGEQWSAFWSWTPTWEAGRVQERQENVREEEKKFRLEAQQLAHRVANQYFDYAGKVSSGHGPPFLPMDAVINRNVGLPRGISAAPPPPAAPSALQVTALPPPPPPAPVTATRPPGAPPPLPTRNIGEGRLAPPEAVEAPPVAPLPPGVPLPPPAVPRLGPGRLPGPPPGGTPPPLPPPPTGLTKPGLPGSPPAPADGLARNPGSSGAPGSPGAPPPSRPGQLRNGVLGRSGPSLPPGASQPPGRTLRRSPGQPGRPGVGELGNPSAPGAPGRAAPPPQPGRAAPPPQPGRAAPPAQPGRPTPPQPGRPGDRNQAERPTGARSPFTPVDADEAFAPPPATTAPPVLKNPGGDPHRRRPGSADEVRTTRAGAGDGGPPRLDGTAPPVLNRPGRPRDTAPGAPVRPDRDRTRRTAPTAPGADWVGVEEARAEAGAGIVDAPPPPPSGSRVSKLEEVPQQLRGRAATRDAATRASAARPGTVAPELTARRVGSNSPETPVEDESPAVITDDQAFGVQTPGGGVVSGKRDEPAYRPEPPKALGKG